MNFCSFFSSRAEKSPDHIAIIYGNSSLTYKELEVRSSNLAKNLISKGVKKGDVIGLMLYNSPDLIVGILGILKAGGIYLPLDPNYPINRIYYMITDSRARAVIIDEETNNIISDFDGKIYQLNKELSECNSAKLPEISLDQDAYIIYTSGSTGNPKGIVVTHSALSHAATAFAEIHPNIPISLLTGSISFDPSILIIIHALLLGGAISLFNNRGSIDAKNFSEIINNIDETAVDFILSTPSFYSSLLENASQLPSLKFVYLCGEVIPEYLIDRHIAVSKNANLYNAYGPSEYAIGSTVATIYDSKNKIKNKVTIGKCFSSNKIYILDPNLKPVPFGIKGEIFVGGPGLAKGYLNNQILNQEKFLTCQGLEEYPVKLFRTGDLGYQLANGDIIFTGRIDFQIKIYGHRVELEEIECQVLAFFGIDKAIATVKNKKIIVFYSKKENDFKQTDLENYLNCNLPSYMVPSSLIEVNQWPLTKNGKIDRMQLSKMIN
ncbi:MAG: amino acid adenylation domain-containing protein [Verrucomicrobia bacterium]|nr:amino acid adenylation domain-containing protein [Verrucomicrobiota bacterium]